MRRRLVYCALFWSALVAVAVGAVRAGLATEREVGKYMLLALLWYPLDRLLTYLAGWGPRRPTDQDRT